MKTKEFIILILIIGAGIFLTQVHSGKIDLYWDFGEDFLFPGEKFEFQETKKIDSPLPPELHIQNRNGTVEVLGTETEEVSIELDKQIWSRKNEQAQEIAKELNIRVKKGPKRIFLSINREDFRRKRIRTHFVVRVPFGMKLYVDNSHGSITAEAVGDTHITNRNGEVDVRDIRGKLTLKNSYGDVSVATVRGDCSISSRNSTVKATDIPGNVRIDHRYGKIVLENILGNVLVEASHSEVSGQTIGGKTEIETSYRNISLFDVSKTTLIGNNGNMEINGAGGDIDIHGRYGGIKLRNIQGSLSINGRYLGIQGEKITGSSIIISSSYRFVELVEFSGETSIVLNKGDINLTPLPLVYGIEAKGDYADITFFWPAGQEYPFEARARIGDIQWELNEELSYNKKNGITHIKAFPGGSGPGIYLESKYGTIRIKESKKPVQ